MAFWGHSFIFNGIPCEEFDLMMYNISGSEPGASKFASGVTVVEQKLPCRWKPIFYGTKMEDRLEFSLIFGVNQRRIDKNEYFSRYELEAIASWLTGHDRYLWLEIKQEDMSHARYNCMITGLETVEFGNVPIALKASVTCDGPYAYMYPKVYEYHLTGDDQEIDFYNESSHNGYFKPRMEYVPDQSDRSITIVNDTDNGREFRLGSIDMNISKVNIDHDTGVITYEVGDGTNIAGIDLYSDFNFNFLRLLKGSNILRVSGNGTLRIICEFPINVGG